MPNGLFCLDRHRAVGRFDHLEDAPQLAYTPRNGKLDDELWFDVRDGARRISLLYAGHRQRCVVVFFTQGARGFAIANFVNENRLLLAFIDTFETKFSVDVKKYYYKTKLKFFQRFVCTA